MKSLFKIIFVLSMFVGVASATEIEIYKSGLVTVAKADAFLCKADGNIDQKIVSASYKLSVDNVSIASFCFGPEDKYYGCSYESSYPVLFFGSLTQILNDDDAPSFLRAAAKLEMNKKSTSVDASAYSFNKNARAMVIKLKSELPRK